MEVRRAVRQAVRVVEGFGGKMVSKSIYRLSTHLRVMPQEVFYVAVRECVALPTTALGWRSALMAPN
jgi:hypothetical protein